MSVLLSFRSFIVHISFANANVYGMCQVTAVADAPLVPALFVLAVVSCVEELKNSCEQGDSVRGFGGGANQARQARHLFMRTCCCPVLLDLVHGFHCFVDYAPSERTDFPSNLHGSELKATINK